MTPRKKRLVLDPIYTSSNPYGGTALGAVLRCTEHPDWEVDVDGTSLPDVIHRAEKHVREHGGKNGQGDQP